MRTFPTLIFSMGILFFLASLIRYYIIVPDLDKCLAYGLIGLLLQGFGFLLNKVEKQEATLEGVEDYLASMKRK